MRGAVHHLDLTVRDLEASAAFYEPILRFLGYWRTRTAADGIDWDLFGPQGQLCSIGLKPAL